MDVGGEVEEMFLAGQSLAGQGELSGQVHAHGAGKEQQRREVLQLGSLAHTTLCWLTHYAILAVQCFAGWLAARRVETQSVVCLALNSNLIMVCSSVNQTIQ